MRRIICRFRNEEDLKRFGKKFDVEFTKDVKEFNVVTKEMKIKKPSKKQGMRKTEWMDEWVDMPEWRLDFANEEYAKITLYFDDSITSKELTEIFEGAVSDKTLSMWYPKLKAGQHRDLRLIGGRKPRYPIYVVSKGRFEKKSWHTSFRLSQLCIKHFLVVEPQEEEIYKKNFNDEFVEILVMDLKYKDTYEKLCDDPRTGPGAVRNFCWDDSIKRGYAYHWVLDDNIDGFNYWFRGHRLLSRTGETFAQLEDFVERYENVPLAGLNYSKFCVDGGRPHPYTLNTRIYSMLLIKNDIPFRWRGTWNEDTILSLDLLTSGYCTIQFNLFLGEKLTTQKIGGGNTEEFYAKEGTYNKTDMLVDAYPQYCKAVYKFHRYHHQVDYSGFTQKLIKKENYEELVNINNEQKDMETLLVRIPRELCNTEFDNADWLWEHKGEFERVDNTDIYL